MRAWVAELEATDPARSPASHWIAHELTRRMAAAYAPVALPPALVPQPPPANPPRGEPVWPLVIAEAAGNEAPPDLVSLMRARDQQGRAKYGVPLCANDGRDTTMDALQEALNLIVYLRKRRAEGREGSEWWEYEVVCVARSLLAELEIEKKHAEGER